MRGRAWDLALLALVAVHLLPIWAVGRFATQDGPAHLENAVALLRLSGDPLLRAFYELNPALVPNWLGHAALALLAAVVPPTVAEKVLLSGYVIALPLAFRLALPAAARARGFALAALPFVYSYPFHMGFVNFCYGLALLFLALGIWQRGRGRLGPPRAAALAIVSLLVAASHALAFLALCGVLGLLFLARAARSLARARGGRRRPVARAYARIALAAAAALVPGAAVVGAFVLGPGGGEMIWLSLPDRLRGLALLRALVAVDPREVLVSGGLALAIVASAAAAAWGARPGLREPGWLAAALCAAVAAVAAPDRIGNGLLVTSRLQLFPFLFALVWIGSQRRLPRLALSLPVVAALASTATLAWRAPTYAKLSAYLDEYVSAAPHVARGSTLLPLALTVGKVFDGESWIPYAYSPLLHAAGYVAVERDGIDLDNYEATVGHFPLRFRAGRDPFELLAPGLGLAGIEGFPPCVDLGASPAIRVDYVLVWGSPEAFPAHPCVRRWTAQLAAGYELAFESRPGGWARLWRRR